MKKRDANRSLIYRWRYKIGYTMLAVFFAFALVFLSQATPGGLSDVEMDNAVSSYNIHDDTLSEKIIDAPYRFLQKWSIGLFGLSLLSVKLPSLIIGFFCALGTIIILNRWYKSNVAILASSLAVTSSLFLQMSNSGRPNIMYIFWPLVIMILGSLIANEKRPHLLATLALFAALALSMYTPFMIYIVVAITVASIIHPHLRFSINSIPRPHFIIGILLFAILIAPLVVSAVIDSGVIGGLFAGGNLEGFNFLDRLSRALQPFLSFDSAQDSKVLMPVLGLAQIALVILGLSSSYKDRYSAKNYILVVWAIFTVLTVALSPEKITLLFLPLSILIASGIEFILDFWYGLFPENPYARIGGLLPISFFIIVTILTGVWHFSYGYYYTPQVAKHFSDDIGLVNSNLEDGTVILVGDDSEYEFYKILESQKDIKVTRELPETISSTLVVLRSYESRQDINYPLGRIVTSAKADAANRLYIYKNE